MKTIILLGHTHYQISLSSPPKRNGLCSRSFGFETRTFFRLKVHSRNTNDDNKIVSLRLVCLSLLITKTININNAALAIRYPPDIRPRSLPGLIFSNKRPGSVTNWISTCGLNRFATCSLRSAECHRVKPTANLVCVISEVTGAQLVTAAQHTTEGWFSIIKKTKYMWRLLCG